MSILRRGLDFVLDALFPPLCINCNTYLAGGERENLLCTSCFANIPVYETFSSPQHGFTLFTVSSYESEPLRNLLHVLKYRKFPGAKKPLGKLVLQYLRPSGLGVFLSECYPDAVIAPVPLHGKRLRERGFNQADIIAGILGKELNLRVEPHALKRIRDTKQQTKMKSRAERAENIKGCFAINKNFHNIPRGTPVILVDDVYTSGATMHEAAKTLRKAGIKNIIGFVIAKTN